MYNIKLVKFFFIFLLCRISVTYAEGQKNAAGAKEHGIFLKSFGVSDMLVAFNCKRKLGIS